MSDSPIDLSDYAAQALADAMAWRLDPLNDLPPTDDMIKQATQVVAAMLDLVGRDVIVLVSGSEADAKRLAQACGKDSEQHIGEALSVLERLAELAPEL
jgi:hypothetical protein